MRVSPKFSLSRLTHEPGAAAPTAERLAWPAVEAHLASDCRVILPMGSQEQHGRHLPLAVDWMIPYALAKFVSARTGVPCFSPLCYGMSCIHSAFPGTISLRPETLMAVCRDVFEELHRQGLRRVLVINGHGGNINAINSALATLVKEYADLRVAVHNWWTIPPVGEICLRAFGDLDSHAGPAETSVMLHLFPEAVEMDRATNHQSELLPYYPSPEAIRSLCPDGVMQNRAADADAGIGAKLVSASVAFFAEVVERFRVGQDASTVP